MVRAAGEGNFAVGAEGDGSDPVIVRKLADMPCVLLPEPGIIIRISDEDRLTIATKGRS
jgi:hypothetical protein